MTTTSSHAAGSDVLYDPVTQAVCQHIATTMTRMLDREILEKTKDHVIDTTAAIISGTQLPAGRAAKNYVATLGGLPQATVVSASERIDVVNAAMANGMAAHGDETDDFHMASITHPGSAVVPAAMAVGEHQRCTGLDFLRAVAVGYDLCGRMPVAVDCYHHFSSGRGMHAFGGMFGAVASAASLMNLGLDEVAASISLTVQQASGLTCWRRDEAHIEKAFDFAGMAARNGVASATMAASGISGVADALTGKNGLFQVFAPPGFDWSSPWKDLGQRFEVMESSIKKWSVGSPGQAALDAVAVLINDYNVTPTEIAEINIHIPDDVSHIVDEGTAPNVNIRHLVALYLVDRQLGFASTHDETRWSDPDVIAVREKARVTPSAELTVARPRRQAIVEITTNDGRTLRHHTKFVRGTPNDPMSRKEVIDKARDLIAPVFSRDRCDDILKHLESFESLENINTFTSLLRP